MNTKALEKFAQAARRQLHEQVAAKLERVISTDTAELRANPAATTQLRQEIKAASKAAVIERVAYTWFNRFCALRYMDANGYTPIGIVSPAPGFTQPELLQEAKQGVIDPALEPYLDRERLFALLGGRLPAADPQQEAYRLLLVAACNQQHETMPFLFEPIDDYTELLLPDDLLSAGSVLHATREALTVEVCRELGVEVIGWLYQFYISEKKDEVIGAKQKITPDNIPAATQLFTPHWIVRYLLENSLGRLWLLNRPTSRLAERMEYYVPPQQENDEIRVHPRWHSQRMHPASSYRETDFLRVNSPEELRICDPAAGSGHMLTYAFDLLYAIYEEEGYAAADIPRLILTHNLYGLEIDERAGALAAFALAMKAREKDRRFFRRRVSPNILVLKPIRFSEEEIAESLTANSPLLPRPPAPLPTTEEREGLRQSLAHDLQLFKEADNFGSLLRPRLSAGQLAEVRQRVEGAGSKQQGDWLAQERQRRTGRALLQAEALARQYHVVVTNPPYMGNFNDRLNKFLNDNYKDFKSDLFAAFTVRIMEMTRKGGFIGMMTPFTWMFLSSYKKLRQHILKNSTLTNLVRPEYHAFFDSAYVPICGFTLYTMPLENFEGTFIDLNDFYGADLQPVKALEAIRNINCSWRYRASAADLHKLPNSPIAYWVSSKVRELFAGADRTIKNFTISEGQTLTGDNDRFLRQLWEVAQSDVGKTKNWRLHPKGGPFRKWFGNVDWVINWSDQARRHYREDRIARILPEYLWNKPGILWTLITSAKPSFRLLQEEELFNKAAPSLFFKNESYIPYFLGLLNSNFVSQVLQTINPTMNLNIHEVRSLPVMENLEAGKEEICQVVNKCLTLAKEDWDSYETSWDFSELPLLRAAFRRDTLAATYAALRQQWRGMVAEMQRLEEENNRLFIEAYGLQDELTPEVPLAEITLSCNPHYRYGGQGSRGAEEQGRLLAARWPEVAEGWPEGEAGLELRLLADTMRELVSYAVGCMFGRYSLDKPGLILANQGETVEDYVRMVNGKRGSGGAEEQGSGGAGEQRSGGEGVLITRHSPLTTNRFLPDKDNAIPMLEGEWFEDDVTERFKRFLRVAFGEERYEENLAFVEAALGRDIRGYFLREFYDDHLRRYQKRPIYWLFSSPGGHFNALVYLHRYRPDTVSVVLNDYLREFRSKLTARRAHLERVERSAAATPREKSRALKEMAQIDKMLHDLRDYEDHILYPLATRQVALDLDDGVKVNYGKLGRALRRVAGLSE